MQRYLLFIDDLSTWVGKIFSWCILILTAVTSYDVVMRYGFSAPTGWAYDTEYILYGTLFMMAGAYTLSQDSHVRGDFIARLMPFKVRAGIEQGQTFVEPLKASGVFPIMVSQMIGVGEQTGALDAMLSKIADFYEQEVDSAIANLLSLMEPAMIMFLGVTIGTIVIAMYLPLFTLIGKLAGAH